METKYYERSQLMEIGTDGEKIIIETEGEVPIDHLRTLEITRQLALSPEQFMWLVDYGLALIQKNEAETQLAYLKENTPE